MPQTKTSKILVVLALISTLALCEMLESPLRARLNNDLLRIIIHKKDQDLFKLFDGLELAGPHVLADGATITDLKITLAPSKVSIEDYDISFDIETDKSVTLAAKDVSVKATGKLVVGEASEDFSMEGPVSELNIKLDVVETGENKFDFNSFNFKIDKT